MTTTTTTPATPAPTSRIVAAVLDGPGPWATAPGAVDGPEPWADVLDALDGPDGPDPETLDETAPEWVDAYGWARGGARYARELGARARVVSPDRGLPAVRVWWRGTIGGRSWTIPPVDCRTPDELRAALGVA